MRFKRLKLSALLLLGLGLTGVQATTSVGDSGLILQYYRTLTPKVSSGYTIKTPA